MALTPKQERFCIEVASGKNKSEAYRLAYNAENMKAETVNERASKLSKEYKVSTRIEELIKPVKEKVENELNLTLEGQILELNSLKALAVTSEKYGDAINAVKEQNKLLGLYERHNEQKNAPKPPRKHFVTFGND